MSIFDKKKSKKLTSKSVRNGKDANAEGTGREPAEAEDTTSRARKDRNPKPAGSSEAGAARQKAPKLSTDERRALAEATLREQATAEKVKSEASSVQDATVKALYQRGIVTVDQVNAALEFGTDSSNLWRLLLDVEGVNHDDVYRFVATTAGFREFPYLDATPSREFIDELVPGIGRETMITMLNNGLLAVDFEPGLSAAPSRVTLVTKDPTHPSLREILESMPFSVELTFAPESAVASRLEAVYGWLHETSRYGTDPDMDVLAPSETDLADGESGVVDLGSYAADGALAIESKANFESEPPVDTNSMDHGDAREKSHPELTAVDSPKIQDGPKSVSASPPLREANQVRDRVLNHLLEKGIVTVEQIAEAQRKTKNVKGKDAAWRYLAQSSGVNREYVFREVADLYAFKHAEITETSPDQDFVLLTMETIVESHREQLIDAMLIPFELFIDTETGAGRIIFATHDPTRPDINVLLHQLDLGRFEVQYAPEKSIHRLLNEIFPRRNEFLDKLTNQETAFDLGINHQNTNATMVDEDALEAEMSRSNLINLFEATLIEAVRKGVSDIHVFPNARRQVEIHFRTDGRLKLWHTEEAVHPEAFLAVVKDNARNVDRFERDKAQDGFIQRTIDDTLIRFRVSILPIATANAEIRAESIVIRILDDRKVMTDLGALGMLDSAKERFDKAIRQPHGMVILTGPTGSGKSTTLVASLYQVITPEVNVLTVEDPVEYIIRGVRQIKLSHKLGVEDALRSILRHDPDIVMVGEMRDQQTAELAIKLANTGHLTFSTLHTNDAPAAVSRLYKMGVEPFLIAYAINLVVAQRLIRTVCPDCRTPDDDPDRVLMKSLGWTEDEIEDATLFKANRGSGCSTCNSAGYKGRRALCETLYFSSNIRQMIASSEDSIDEESIRRIAIEEGMLTLEHSARVLVSRGETTVSEMLKVVGSA